MTKRKRDEPVHGKCPSCRKWVVAVGEYLPPGPTRSRGRVRYVVPAHEACGYVGRADRAKQFGKAGPSQ